MLKDDLIDALEKLLILLRNPEPGLSTWHEACQRTSEKVEQEIAKARC